MERPYYTLKKYESSESLQNIGSNLSVTKTFLEETLCSHKKESKSVEAVILCEILSFELS